MFKKKKYVDVSFSIPEEVWDLLQQLTTTENTSISEILKKSIILYGLGLSYKKRGKKVIIGDKETDAYIYLPI